MWRTGECGGKGGVVDRWVRRTGECGVRALKGKLGLKVIIAADEPDRK